MGSEYQGAVASAAGSAESDVAGSLYAGATVAATGTATSSVVGSRSQFAQASAQGSSNMFVTTGEDGAESQSLAALTVSPLSYASDGFGTAAPRELPVEDLD